MGSLFSFSEAEAYLICLTQFGLGNWPSALWGTTIGRQISLRTPFLWLEKSLLRALAPFDNLRKRILSRFVDIESPHITMGGSISRIMSKLFANREMRILMLGLDAAGKTSNSPSPRAGPNVSLFPFRHISLDFMCS